MSHDLLVQVAYYRPLALRGKKLLKNSELGNLLLHMSETGF